jgi:hypothetical protein
VATSQADQQIKLRYGPRAPRAPDRRSRPRWRWATALAVLLCGCGLYVAYVRQARAIPVGMPERGADGASQAVQAWDMLHGNWLLSGWSLSDVSFYTTELPQYAAVELIKGLSTEVVHVVAALDYTLMVLLAGWLAKGRATGAEATIRALTAAGIMLAPPLGALPISTTYVVLSYPDHTGTQLPLMVIWLVIDRAPRRWWVPIVIAVLLAWVQVADAMALYEGAFPLVVVCAVRLLRRRSERSSWPWYELSLAIGAIASAAAATFLLRLIRQAGGFAVSPPGIALTSPNVLVHLAVPKLKTALIVFGADFVGQPAGRAVIPLVHLIGLALVVCAVAYAIWRFLREDDLLVQVLTVAFVVVLGAYAVGFRVGAWEIVGLLPTGAVLAGRLLAPKLIRLRLISALAAVLACYAAFLAYGGTTATRAPDPNRRLVSLLKAHRLTSGLAPYWQASSITTATGDRVQVRPIGTAHGGLVVRLWNVDARWYDPHRHDARFVIWSASARTSVATWYRIEGRPAKIYHLGDYLVLVWDKNLLNAPISLGTPVSRDVVA